MDTTPCPQCGALADVRERLVLESTEGPVEHLRTFCVRGHPSLMSVAGLVGASRPRSAEAPVPAGEAGPRPAGVGGSTRVLLLCSAFNGLSQRAWLELRAAGHEVAVVLSGDDDTVRAAVAAADPDLIICPFLRERVPADVCDAYDTVVVHPGPRGDRGPSALDWAIMDAEPVWGVTAVAAVEEFDAGPIWGSRTFPVGPDAPRKSALYHGEVTDAAAALIHDVVASAADPAFVPEPLDYARPDVRGRLRPPARQADRGFRWSDPTEYVLRRIRAADGSPGVHSTLCGIPVAVFDAHRAGPRAGEGGAPGTIAARRHGAVLVRTGDGGVWVGHLRSRADAPRTGLKLPATTVLSEHLTGVPVAPAATGYEEIDYRRDGHLGVLSFRFYNGAMSTAQCRRLCVALRHAVAQDTRVLLLRGGEVFSNGIHLGVIEAAPDPAAEAWANIVAIDDVCREIITCTGQLVVCSVAGNAGAGGVMLGLGADRVLLREGAVLNPHYATMGLHGSEYWTYVLPRRVGEPTARSLTGQCLPIGAAEAARIGLADVVLPGSPAVFESAVERYAAGLAGSDDHPALLAAKRAGRAADERRRPLGTYRRDELIEMSGDIHGDRHGFTRARASFLRSGSATAAPATRGVRSPSGLAAAGGRRDHGAA